MTVPSRSRYSTTPFPRPMSAPFTGATLPNTFSYAAPTLTTTFSAAPTFHSPISPTMTSSSFTPTATAAFVPRSSVHFTAPAILPSAVLNYPSSSVASPTTTSFSTASYHYTPSRVRSFSNYVPSASYATTATSLALLRSNSPTPVMTLPVQGNVAATQTADAAVIQESQSRQRSRSPSKSASSPVRASSPKQSNSVSPKQTTAISPKQQQSFPKQKSHHEKSNSRSPPRATSPPPKTQSSPPLPTASVLALSSDRHASREHQQQQKVELVSAQPTASQLLLKQEPSRSPRQQANEAIAAQPTASQLLFKQEPQKESLSNANEIDFALQPTASILALRSDHQHAPVPTPSNLALAYDQLQHQMPLLQPTASVLLDRNLHPVKQQDAPLHPTSSVLLDRYEHPVKDAPLQPTASILLDRNLHPVKHQEAPLHPTASVLLDRYEHPVKQQEAPLQPSASILLDRSLHPVKQRDAPLQPTASVLLDRVLNAVPERQVPLQPTASELLLKSSKDQTMEQQAQAEVPLQPTGSVLLYRSEQAHQVPLQPTSSVLLERSQMKEASFQPTASALLLKSQSPKTQQQQQDARLQPTSSLLLQRAENQHQAPLQPTNSVLLNRAEYQHSIAEAPLQPTASILLQRSSPPQVSSPVHEAPLQPTASVLAVRSEQAHEVPLQPTASVLLERSKEVPLQPTASQLALAVSKHEHRHEPQDALMSMEGPTSSTLLLRNEYFESTLPTPSELALNRQKHEEREQQHQSMEVPLHPSASEMVFNETLHAQRLRPYPSAVALQPTASELLLKNENQLYPAVSQLALNAQKHDQRQVLHQQQEENGAILSLPTVSMLMLNQTTTTATTPRAFMKQVESVGNVPYSPTSTTHSTALIHLINEQKQFNREAFSQVMQSLQGYDYRMVTIFGSQSTGKSTLLNKLFGTKFDVMQEQKRQQTTKGIWLSAVQDAASLTVVDSNSPAPHNLLVLDVEGTDGRERGDDQDFERKSALFSLALSQVVLINMWEHQIGLYHGANMHLLKTVMEVHLHLFAETKESESSLSKTLLLFVVRDHLQQTPKEDLQQTLLLDLDRLWQSMNKPVGKQEAKWQDSFDVQFHFLPHKVLQGDAFVAAIEEFAHWFSDVHHPHYVFNTAAYHKRIPADGLAFYAEQLWDKIDQHKDLDLPTQQQLLAQYRCDELALVSTQLLKESLIPYEQALQHAKVFATLGADLSLLEETCLQRFDKEAQRYHVEVFRKKRQTLVETCHSLCLPLVQEQLRLLSRASQSALSQTLTELGSETFFAVAKEAVQVALTQWQRSVQASLPESLSATFHVDEMKKTLAQEWQGLVQERMNRLLQQFLDSTVDEFSVSLPALIQAWFQGGDDEKVYDSMNESLLQLKEKVSLKLQSQLHRAFEWPQEQITPHLDKVLAILGRALWLQLKQETSDTLMQSRVRQCFERAFKRDAQNVPRVFTPQDNLEALFASAREKSLALLKTYSKLRMNRPLLKVFQFVASGAMVESEEDDTVFLLVIPSERYQSLEATCQRDMESLFLETKRSLLSTGPATALPPWIWILLLVLGWNELMAVLTNPLYLILLLLAVGAFISIRGLGLQTVVQQFVWDRIRQGLVEEHKNQ